MSDHKADLRSVVEQKLAEIVREVNLALRGETIEIYKPILQRLGRGALLPHWVNALKESGVLPNLDGKTIGSVVEMIFVAVLETKFLAGKLERNLRINPARGVDLPDLDLGIKSPSENYCTSEPFYSAYERLLGGEFDALVLLTDYQAAKKSPPLKLQIIGHRYLKATQIADRNLCALAKAHRDWLVEENDARAKKLFRFLAYVNQSDWQGRQLVNLLRMLNPDKAVSERAIDEGIARAAREWDAYNTKALRRDKPTIPREEVDALMKIKDIYPRHIGLIEAADNWVLETLKEAGRAPSDAEWRRLATGPLDGVIGMSFALQWRYNFGPLFGRQDDTEMDVAIDRLLQAPLNESDVQI